MPAEAAVSTARLQWLRPLTLRLHPCTRADFGGYINTAFAGIAETLKMQPKDVHRIVTNSFVASFITDEQRRQWLPKSTASTRKSPARSRDWVSLGVSLAHHDLQRSAARSAREPLRPDALMLGRCGTGCLLGVAQEEALVAAAVSRPDRCTLHTEAPGHSKQLAETAATTKRWGRRLHWHANDSVS